MIDKAVNVSKVRSSGDLDFTNLADDLMMLSDMIVTRHKTGDFSKDAQIRERFNELDMRGLGIDIADALQNTIKSRGENMDLTTIQSNITSASMTDLVDQERAAAIAHGSDVPQNEYEALFKTMLDSLQEGKEDQDTLLKRQKALSEVLKTTIEFYDKLTGGENASDEGKTIGKDIRTLGAKMRAAGSSLDGFKDFNEKFTNQTNKTGEMIGAVTELTESSISALQELSTHVGKLEIAVAELKGQPIVIGH